MNEKLICLLRFCLDCGHRLNAFFLKERDFDYSQAILNHMEELKAAIKELEHGANTQLACHPEEAHNQAVNEEREINHLTHAIHDLRVEIVRATERFKSFSEAVSKTDLINTESKINMKVSELAGSLNEVKNSALKGFSEVRNRIDAADARIIILEKSLSDADIPAEAEAALADLKVISKQLDDIVPDVPDLPPVPTPAPTPA